MAMASVTELTLLQVFVSLDRIQIRSTRTYHSILMAMDYQTTILLGLDLHMLTMMTTTMDSQMHLKMHVVLIHSMRTAFLLTWMAMPSVTVMMMTRTATELTTSTKQALLACLRAVHQSILIRMVTESVTDLNLQ